LRNVEGYERTFKSCYGAYLFLSTETFNELDGFDERFFLFYEETDFCKRLLDNGFTNYMLDRSITYFHDQGYSSKKVATKTNFHMIQSRKLYLIKHHGMFYAILDNLLVSLSSWKSFLRYLIS
jgi:GT2 family glycosyltransferase